MRWVPRVLAALLFVWMAVLVLVGPASRDFEVSGGDRWTVSCASVVEAGWPWKGDPERAQDDTGGPLTESYEGESVLLPSDVTQQYVVDRCQDLRTARVGFAVLLAVPTVLLGVTATGRRGSRLPSS